MAVARAWVVACLCAGCAAWSGCQSLGDRRASPPSAPYRAAAVDTLLRTHAPQSAAGPAAHPETAAALFARAGATRPLAACDGGRKAASPPATTVWDPPAATLAGDAGDWGPLRAVSDSRQPVAGEPDAHATAVPAARSARPVAAPPDSAREAPGADKAPTPPRRVNLPQRPIPWSARAAMP